MTKKILIFLLAFMATGLMQAQTFFEMGYTDKDNQPKRALIVFNGKEEYSEIITYSVLRPGQMHFNKTYVWSDAKVKNKQIPHSFLETEDADSKAPSLIFWWDPDLTEIVQRTPYIRFDKKETDLDKMRKADWFNPVTLLMMDENFIKQYYTPDEEMYHTLLTAHNTAVKEEQELVSRLPDGTNIFKSVYSSFQRIGIFNGDVEDFMQKELYPNYYKAFGVKAALDQNTYNSNGEIIQQTQSVNNPEQGPHRNRLMDEESPADATKPTLHTFVVANTLVSDIGAASRVDYRRVTSEMKGVASRIDMNYKEYRVSGQDFSKATLVQKLSELQPGPNDVVFFLYTGHGFRFDNQVDKYPMFAMVTNDYVNVMDGNYVALSDVNNAIVQKGARLNIVMSDCCNSLYGAPTPLPLGVNTLESRGNANLSTERLKELFLNQQGNILSTASSPGEVSWCSQSGGGFVCSFLDAFRKSINLLSDKAPSWDEILNTAIEDARKFSSTNGTTIQNGLKELQLKPVKR